MKGKSPIPLLLLIVALCFALGGKWNPVAPILTPKATAATYVYEKDQHTIPNPVASALNRLNREKGIVATAFEVDTTDGTGEVPDQYKVPVDAAKKAGLPTLVVTAGQSVVKVVKSPTTEEQVMGAIE